MKINPKLYYIIPIFTAVGIFIVSSVPQENIPNMPFEFGDKVAHLTAYFLFACTILFSLVMNTDLPKKKLFLYTFLIGAIYAAGDEIHQYFVPGRSADILDWVADVIGIALSLPMNKVFYKFKHKSNENTNI